MTFSASPAPAPPADFVVVYINQDKQQRKQQPFVAAAEQQSVTVTPPIAPPIAAVAPVVAPLAQAQDGQFATQLKFSQILM